MLVINKEFFIFLRAESGELPLEAGESDPLVPKFPLELRCIFLRRIPGNNFICYLECACKLALEASKFV